MRSAALLVLGLAFVGVSQDGASGQTAPPVSLVPPKETPPRAGAKNTPPTSSRMSPAPLISAPAPNPAVDYDGLAAGTVEDDAAPSQVPPPARSRAAKNAKPNTDNGIAGQLIDQEDEALKRKLTICNACK